MLIFYFGVILPEIIGFFGFVFLKKKTKILGAIIMTIAVFVAIEILPIRRSFLFDNYMTVMYPSVKLKPFGKLDREFEFKRSLKTIEDLAVKSNSYPNESLVTITMYMPDLEKYPNILGLNTNRTDWKDIVSQFEKKMFRLNVKLDSDGDGLGDFREAELLSDAYNKDTDGDGINDREDSDPLNPYKESDFGEIKAAVLGFYVDSFPFYLIENNFHDGRGEFGNFDEHVITLNYKQLRLWDDIFGKQNISGYYPIYTGPGGSGLPYIAFLKYSFDIFRKINIVLVRLYYSGIECDGVLYLLIKWRGEWRVLGGRVLWT
ncbi:thrombospondin type 3 repeat-containing protein [candidate division WOR-3 bacterium]|nr:thrombospondin type 3 repeat-containing protein [candidate division WOR-3 bacterium]